MVKITPAAGGFYCIDKTEVTQQQYSAWLASNPSTSGQVSGCSGNSSFVPACAYNPVNKAAFPVSCLDWCDAYAFCKGIGKRLCGKIGGGAVAASGTANAAQSQWYNACSQGGARLYPYGNLYDFGANCNGLDSSNVGTTAAGALALCQGGYPNIFDMSGNVREWEDSCDGSGNCAQRGGGYLDHDTSSPSLKCTSAETAKRMDTSDQRGFRCCWDGT